MLTPRFDTGMENLILTVKSQWECCNDWDDVPDRFAEKANLIRRVEDGIPVLTNLEGQGVKSADHSEGFAD